MVPTTPGELFLGWLILGVVLMLLELLLPGGVAFFMGASAVIMAALVWSGLLGGMLATVAGWLLLTVALCFAGLPYVRRRFGGDASREVLDEDVQVVGSEVEVVAPIDEAHEQGRIRFRGSLWAARSKQGRIEAGRYARLVHRDNLTWVVEPVVSSYSPPSEEPGASRGSDG